MKIVEDYMSLTRVELACLCKQHRPKKRYEIQDLASKYKCKALLLPVGHPELNPIEMIWAKMKDYIKKKNTNFSLTDDEKYAREFFESFDESEWVKYINHVKKVEEEYLKVADEIPISM